MRIRTIKMILLSLAVCLVSGCGTLSQKGNKIDFYELESVIYEKSEYYLEHTGMVQASDDSLKLTCKYYGNGFVEPSQVSARTESVLYVVRLINSELDLPSYIEDEMKSTRQLDGLKKEEFPDKNLLITWEYSPDTGLDVAYYNK